MLAWVGGVFAVLLLVGCLYDAVMGATAEALAAPAPIETLDGIVRSAEAANDEVEVTWSTAVSPGVSNIDERPRAAA